MRVIQFVVSIRSESHLWVRQECATSPRSNTTWSIERSARQRLMASPQCPAPTTMADVFSMVSLLTSVACSGHVDGDGDGGGVGEDVVDRRPLLRLRDKGLDLFRGCVGVDLVAHTDAGEAV